jgi:hypothetical protein
MVIDESAGFPSEINLIGCAIADLQQLQESER